VPTFTGTNLGKAIKLSEVCKQLWGIYHQDGKFPACGMRPTAGRQPTARVRCSSSSPQLHQLPAGACHSQLPHPDSCQLQSHHPTASSAGLSGACRAPAALPPAVRAPGWASSGEPCLPPGKTRAPASTGIKEFSSLGTSRNFHHFVSGTYHYCTAVADAEI